MWRIAAILAAIAAFVYVAVAGVQWLQPRVEEDIANRVNTALAEQGLLWADVAVDGRQVVLSGEAPGQDAHDRALTVASRVFGVAGVSDATVVAEAVSDTVAAKPGKAQPYQLTIEKAEGSILVRGQVASEQDAEVIRRIIRTHYDGMTVEDALEVKADAPAGWRSAVGVVLMNMTNLEKAQVTISGTEVMLEGEVLDQKYSDQLQNAIRNALPSGYKVAFAVDVVTPAQLAEDVANDVSGTEVSATTVSATETVSRTTADVVKAGEPAKPAKAEAASINQLISSETAKRDAKTETSTAAKAEAAPADVAADCSGVADAAKQVVYFDFDKAALKSEYRPVIRKVAGALKGCPSQHLVVAGYTDRTGSSLYNQWLSEQRAESGVRALRRQGVDGSQLSAVGYGDINPKYPNTSRESRAKNRRIEFQPGEAKAAAGTRNEAPKQAAKTAKVSKADAVSPVEAVSASTKVDSEAAEPTTSSTGWWSALLGGNKAAAGTSDTTSATSVTEVSRTAK